MWLGGTHEPGPPSPPRREERTEPRASPGTTKATASGWVSAAQGGGQNPPSTYRGFGVQAIALGAGAEGGAQGRAVLTTCGMETEEST